MNNTPAPSFSEFLEYFPILKPPVHLLPDIQQIPYSSQPLPGIFLDAFILPFEGEEMDDFTEYIPIGRVEGTHDFYALIYWKAGIMQYEYVLATFSLAGKPLSHAIVGGIRYQETEVLLSVGVIHENMDITIAEGISTEEMAASIDDSNTYQMSIQPSGQISYGSNEEVEKEP